MEKIGYFEELGLALAWLNQQEVLLPKKFEDYKVEKRIRILEETHWETLKNNTLFTWFLETIQNIKDALDYILKQKNIKDIEKMSLYEKMKKAKELVWDGDNNPMAEIQNRSYQICANMWIVENNEGGVNISDDFTFHRIYVAQALAYKDIWDYLDELEKQFW